MTLKLYGLKEIPLVKKGDNIAKIIEEDLEKENMTIEDGDILLIAETLISKAEGNYIKIDELEPSEETIKIAENAKRTQNLLKRFYRNQMKSLQLDLISSLPKPSMDSFVQTLELMSPMWKKD